MSSRKHSRAMYAGRKKKPSRLQPFLAVMIMAVCIVVGILLLGYRQGQNKTPIIDYVPIITANAQAYGLEEEYIAAVIMAESSYRANAVSSADARGLMQLLPSTAQWVAKKLGESFDEQSLFQPETNIRYGCWYLSFLMDKYNGNMRCASAAYHAGQGTVDSWLKNPNYSSNGETLDVIAYSSTNTYVNRVLNYYEQYISVFKNIQASGADIDR